MDSGLYKVVVKSLIEDRYDEKNHVQKYKKLTENFIVKAGSPKDAAIKTEMAYDGITYEWRIDSVKELKIDGIIE